MWIRNQVTSDNKDISKSITFCWQIYIRNTDAGTNVFSPQRLKVCRGKLWKVDSQNTAEMKPPFLHSSQLGLSLGIVSIQLVGNVLLVQLLRHIPREEQRVYLSLKLMKHIEKKIPPKTLFTPIGCFVICCWIYDISTACLMSFGVVGTFPFLPSESLE